MIRNLIRIETGYINTNHPDFIGGSRAISACKLLHYWKWRILASGPLAVSKFLQSFLVSCNICSMAYSSESPRYALDPTAAAAGFHFSKGDPPMSAMDPPPSL
ncbi:Dynamin-1-like protein, partial [Perkinsus olseni]